MIMPVKRIAYSRDALRTLRRMPANTSKRIRHKVQTYARNPASLANNVQALKGERDIFRLRVGDWRIIFTEDAEVVAVIRIAPRGSAYN